MERSTQGGSSVPLMCAESVALSLICSPTLLAAATAKGRKFDAHKSDEARAAAPGRVLSRATDMRTTGANGTRGHR